MVDFSPGYSLNNIILDHSRMLRRAGWPYDLLVLKNFNQRDLEAAKSEGLSVKNILPQTVLVDYATSEPPRPTTDDEQGFDDQVAHHLNGGNGAVGYLEALKPYDVVASHDLCFLSWHLPQNAAIRRVIDEYPKKNYLHWIHSGPSLRPDNTCYPSTLRYEAAPESTYVFLNETQRHDCALMLGASHDQIAVVYNSRDPRDLYSFSDETNALVDACDLLNSELLQIYPFSTPRWDAKGVHKLLAVFGEWKKMGVRVKLVLVNAHANSACDDESVEAIERHAAEAGLDMDKDVALTSRFAEACMRGAEGKKDLEAVRSWRAWRHCVPHRVVRELNLLANTFVFPSDSECCSLIQAEAAQSGKFMVLNAQFPAMLEFAARGTLAFDFRSNEPSENPEFYECVAKEAYAKLQTETAILNATKARTTVYNRDWIWRRQLEPLLWRKFSGRRKEERPRGKGHRSIGPPAGSPEPSPAEDARYVSQPAGESALITLEQKIPEHMVEISKGGTWDNTVRHTHVTPPGARQITYEDPWSGMPCPIFGECSDLQRGVCYDEAGHCPMADEVEAK